MKLFDLMCVWKKKDDGLGLELRVQKLARLKKNGSVTVATYFIL